MTEGMLNEGPIRLKRVKFGRMGSCWFGGDQIYPDEEHALNPIPVSPN